MKIDFLIIGQGIAGTCVAHELLTHDKKICVIDLPTENQSSVVAAGICNPITGKKLSLTWEAEKIFAVLAPFYDSIARILGRQVFFPMPFYRRFHTVENQNQLSVRLANADFAHFVEEITDKRYDYWIDSPLDGWQTRHAGFVKVAELLVAYRAKLSELQAFREARFRYEDVEILKNSVKWQDIEATKLIFCEGLQARENPFFPELAFAPNKGEWVKIRIEEPFTCPAILKQGVFCLPLGEGIYQIGATYHQTPLDTLPTEAGKEELLKDLKEWLKVPFEVIEQRAGIRPATRTRRPYMGLHKEYAHIAILNGLGSKGVSLAPFLATELVKMML